MFYNTPPICTVAHEYELQMKKVHILQRSETKKSQLKRLTCNEFIPKATDEETNTMDQRIHLTGQT